MSFKAMLFSFSKVFIFCVLISEISSNKHLNPLSEDYMTDETKSVEYKSQIIPSSEEIDYKIGQIGGIATDSDENLIIFHRASRTWTYSSFMAGNVFNTFLYGPIKEDVLYLINPSTLERLDSWGAGKFYMPHGLTLDFEGNIWLTDVGSHQVFKYNFEKDPSEPLLTLGEKLNNGNDETHFCKPSSVSVCSKTGHIFVADGYCNNRVVQFDKDGKFIKQYQDEKNPIQVAHSIALIENLNLVCTVSREEGRIICFDTETAKKTYDITDESMKTVYAIRYDPINQVIHAATGENKGSEALGLTFDASEKNFGKIVQRWNGEGRDLADSHDLAVSPDGSNIYFAQLNGEIDEFEYN